MPFVEVGVGPVVVPVGSKPVTPVHIYSCVSSSSLSDLNETAYIVINPQVLASVPDFRVPINQVLERHTRILLGIRITRVPIFNQIPPVARIDLPRLGWAWRAGSRCGGGRRSRLTKGFNTVGVIGKEIVARFSDRRILLLVSSFIKKVSNSSYTRKRQN